MSNEFYVECYLNEPSGPTKIADLACERTDEGYRALAKNLAGMYRAEDDRRVQFQVRGANTSDMAAVGAALGRLPNIPVRQAWAVAGSVVTSGDQRREFNADDLAPVSWVHRLEASLVGSAVWRDASWGNNTAPSWELIEGDRVLAEAFYYTTDNGERFTEHFDGQPYVSVLMFDQDENPTVAFETSPDDFIAIVQSTDDRTETAAEAFLRSAEGAPQDRRIFWSKGS